MLNHKREVIKLHNEFASREVYEYMIYIGKGAIVLWLTIKGAKDLTKLLKAEYKGRLAIYYVICRYSLK